MGIYRIQSGKLFDDKHDTLDTVRWEVSPSSFNFDKEDGKLKLEHSDSDTTLLFDMVEEEELLFQVYADYTPETVGDEGGIVVWQSAQEKVEFLERVDTTTDKEYSKWRATKRQNLWTFYAFKDGEWELFDSTVCVNPVRAGIVLKNPQENGYKDLKMIRSVLCKGEHIEVGNVDEGQEVILLDYEENEVARQTVPKGYSGVFLKLPSIPFEGKLTIYNPNTLNNNTMEELTTMYGGDVFLSGTQLSVYWKGKELSTVTPNHLGSLKEGYKIEEKMTLKNDLSESIASNVRIQVAIYNEDWGYKWADLAKDFEGSPTEYGNLLTIGDIEEGGEVDFWLKIEKQSDPAFYTKPTLFLLNIINE